MNKVILIGSAAIAALLSYMTFFHLETAGSQDEIPVSAPVSVSLTSQEDSSSNRAAESNPGPAIEEIHTATLGGTPETARGTASSSAALSESEQKIRNSLVYLPLYLPLSAEKTQRLIAILTERATASDEILSRGLVDPENRSGWREHMEAIGERHDSQLHTLLSDGEIKQLEAFQQVQGGLTDIQHMNTYLPASGQLSNENAVRTLASVLRTVHEEYTASLMGPSAGPTRFDPVVLRNRLTAAAAPYLSPSQLDALARIPPLDDSSTVTARYR